MFNKEKGKSLDILIFLTSILTFFLLWYYYAWFKAENNVKNIWKTAIESNLNMDKFYKVYDLMKGEYYSLDWIKNQDLEDWTISWLVKSIWDKHSEYFNIEETKSFNESLSWDFEWIWAVVEKVEIWVMVERILKWSPASKFNIFKDDIITEANWIKLEWLDVSEAVSYIKWKAWTEVVLKILRKWEKEVLEIKVKREKITIPSVEEETFLDGKIWYIALNIYWDNSFIEFAKALENTKNTKGLIIDLRDNWGWYLESATEILSLFIKNGELLVTTKHKWLAENEIYKSTNMWNIYNWKIVILINGNSASASEITAWALKDYKKAIIVWEKSYGKWSVQQAFPLWDWSEVKLTIAKWFTPKDVNIDEKWIEPDIKVELKKQDYDLEACKQAKVCEQNLEQKDFKFYDRQKEEAKNILSIFIENNDLDKTIKQYNTK